jgi:hypothetical protein
VVVVYPDGGMVGGCTVGHDLFCMGVVAMNKQQKDGIIKALRQARANIKKARGFEPMSDHMMGQLVGAYWGVQAIIDDIEKIDAGDNDDIAKSA